MTVHLLKTWAEPFAEIEAGRKTAEFRSTADRDFSIGDLLGLEAWDNELGCYTDGLLWRVVSHVLPGPLFGVPAGFAMISFRTIDDAKMIGIEIAEDDLGVMSWSLFYGPDEHYRAGNRGRDDRPERLGR